MASCQLLSVKLWHDKHHKARGFNKSQLMVAVYSRLYNPRSSHRCLSVCFINENKMILILKKANTTMTSTEIFKCYKNSTLSDAQNAGNRISDILIFLGGGGGEGGCGMPPDPTRRKGLAVPLVVTATYYTFSGLL